MQVCLLPSCVRSLHHSLFPQSSALSPSLTLLCRFHSSASRLKPSANTNHRESGVSIQSLAPSFAHHSPESRYLFRPIPLP
ncbi:hypothetical protein K469DRAFT_27974 [Zopfia rhizophila CBS 207.26]|uniref:Uncharacterized protein n=1 Tax=Zopfia rhizophila CBS 207.26 TaxID=1314779 RepID=A0A6A6EF30_9PEZI|nr:hypothetical protein K469DRAFT_27974 [Zopfia rhizophila CBS 207.26]